MVGLLIEAQNYQRIFINIILSLTQKILYSLHESFFKARGNLLLIQSQQVVCLLINLCFCANKTREDLPSELCAGFRQTAQVYKQSLFQNPIKEFYSQQWMIVSCLCLLLFCKKGLLFNYLSTKLDKSYQ